MSSDVGESNAKRRRIGSVGGTSTGGFSKITNAAIFKEKYPTAVVDESELLQPPGIDDSVLEYFLGDGGVTGGLAFAQLVVDRELNKEKWRYLYVYEILRSFLRHGAVLPLTASSGGDADAARSPSPSLQLVDVEEHIAFEKDVTGTTAKGESFFSWSIAK